MHGGALCKKKRDERGLSQLDLAAACETSIATISRFERGLHTPTGSTLVAMAKYLGVTTDELLARSAA